jgi:acyl-coenzyme A thioesterase PaaI-like protein
MTATDPREVRRAAVMRLAETVRALADAAAETALDPESLDAVTKEVAALTEQLAARTDDSPYSSLTWPPGDFSVPEGPMPLNPIIGACSPTRPDVQLRYADGEVVGRARFTKRFVGPPGFAHGGISAMLADQIVTVSGQALGMRTLTKALRVRYRRPIPLGTDVALWGVCEPDGDSLRARCTVTVGDDVAVEGTGDLVRFEHFEHRSREKT